MVLWKSSRINPDIPQSVMMSQSAWQILPLFLSCTVKYPFQKGLQDGQEWKCLGCLYKLGQALFSPDRESPAGWCKPESVGVAVGARQAPRGQCPAQLRQPLLREAEARTPPFLIRWLFNNLSSTPLSSLDKLACLIYRSGEWNTTEVGPKLCLLVMTKKFIFMTVQFKCLDLDASVNVL